MKTRILIGCAVLQLLILAAMAGQREWVRRVGRAVYFRTAPIDPRDVMRGDYVRLNYEISRVSRELWNGPLPARCTNFAEIPNDTRVYASLRLNEDGLAQLVSLGLTKPREGLYLRGRTENSSLEQLDVRYGLEALFVEQGKGQELEEQRNRNGIQVPLEVKAAIGSGGITVIQDYRWSALGMGLTFDMTNVVTGTNQRERRPVAAKVQLLNASSNELAVVDIPGGRSLALVPDRMWGQNSWRWTPQEGARSAPEATKVIVLKPGEIHTIFISFDNPWWSVNKTDKPDAVQRLSDLRQDWNARFRFEYRSPDRAASATLPNGNLIWHGDLASRAFSPAGGVD